MRRKIITLIEFTKLIENPSPNLKIPVYDESKEEKPITMHPTRKKSKYTLNQLGTKVDKLGVTVDKLGTTVDKLGMTVNKLAVKVDQISDALFKFIKTSNARFDRIEARLDGIDARLDYNNLKKLPENR